MRYTHRRLLYFTLHTIETPPSDVMEMTSPVYQQAFRVLASVRDRQIDHQPPR